MFNIFYSQLSIFPLFVALENIAFSMSLGLHI